MSNVNIKKTSESTLSNLIYIFFVVIYVYLSYMYILTSFFKVMSQSKTIGLYFST